jgi:hypothetical protein
VFPAEFDNIEGPTRLSGRDFLANLDFGLKALCRRQRTGYEAQFLGFLQ